MPSIGATTLVNVAYGSVRRRDAILQAVRDYGPIAPAHCEAALQTICATAAFDLAPLLDADHRARVQRGIATTSVGGTPATRLLAFDGLRCSPGVMELISYDIAQSAEGPEAVTALVLSVLEQLPITTLPEHPEDPADHIHLLARHAMRVRLLCPSPLPDYAVDAWTAVERWSQTRPTHEEREALYQTHLRVSWPMETPEEQALSTALQTIRGFGVDDLVLGALLGTGATSTAIDTLIALELEALPAGTDRSPTAKDLAGFEDVDVLYLLAQRLARACFEQAIAEADDHRRLDAKVALAVAPEDREILGSAAALRQRAGEHALELADMALGGSTTPGTLRAYSDNTLPHAPVHNARELALIAINMLRIMDPDAWDEHNQASSPLGKLEGLLTAAGDHVHPDLASMLDSPDVDETRDMARDVCGLPS